MLWGRRKPDEAGPGPGGGTEGCVEVLGVYKVPVTPETLDSAMRDKCPEHVPPGHPDRADLERAIRDELESAVLLELVVHGATSRFSMDDFGQKGSDQAPYEEVYLSPDGTQVIAHAFEQPPGDELRVAFFLHFYDPSCPLSTSYGEVACPPVQTMPVRLRELVPYEPVD